MTSVGKSAKNHEARHMTDELMAPKGTVIVCGQCGTKAYRLARDVLLGQVVKPEDVEKIDERLPDPVYGAKTPDCATCGAPIFFGDVGVTCHLSDD